MKRRIERIEQMEDALLDMIKRLLFDTLSIDFHYYKSPIKDISSADRYLRTGLLNSDELYSELLDIFHNAKSGFFYLICDQFLLQYLVIRPFKEKQDIIAIGPYTSHPINDAYFNEITKLNQLTFTQVESLKGFLYRVPLFDNNLQLIAIVNDILDYINPDTQNYEIKDAHLYSKKGIKKPYIPIEDFEILVDSVQKRYQIEEELLSSIAAGNQTNALIASKRFTSSPFEQRLKDAFHDKKALLYSLNTLLRKGAERSKVHPLYLHQTSSKNVRAIDQVTNFSAIDALHEQMIREYCLLVKNKARIQYSLIIRKAINYIEFNISSKLSLSTIAVKLHISPPYLSTQFKKETGSNITDYINQYRIDIALKFLNTSSMQIQDIASYVGIHDLNYFTKLFKKKVGCTPRDYRKKVQ